MNNIRSVVGTINKLTIKSNAKIIDNKIVIKDRKNKNIDKTYRYLKSRSFDYFPEPIEINTDNEIYPYIEDAEEPLEQKAIDLTHLMSLLHNKTTFYREIDIDKNKEIYEDILGRLEYLNNYYTDLITLIEKGAKWLQLKSLVNAYFSPKVTKRFRFRI